MQKRKERVCPGCRISKKLSPKFWHRDRTTFGIAHRDGYQGRCKECRNGKPDTKKNRKRNTADDLASLLIGVSSPPPAEWQTCLKCGASHPLTVEFWRPDTKCKSGFRGVCKACRPKK